MATIFIDNQPYEVEDGQNLLQACLSLGFELPYFCWHPALGSVGACRQCAIKQFKDDKDARGKIVMACMTPAAEGTRLSIDDPEAREFRASVIEWLMVNHPHDCPVCDEGGECHLQDMTVITGHNYRRYRFKKRTYRNQDLGPFINHEMNRCIQCYRCVRFYRDLAGGRDFDVFATHDHVYFGRYQDGPLENEFSGNLVEICPTGVFTDKTLKKDYTRKWDLQTAPSVCTSCGLGCNTLPGERYGQLRRVRNRYNGEVNGYFLCDRGRFGYEFVNSERRIHQPVIRPAGQTYDAGRSPARNATREEALRYLSDLMKGGAKVIGIGSPRASLEANFALRTLAGPENFYLGIPEKELGLNARILDILQNGPARSPSLQDAAQADAVLVLGEDVTNFAPMLAMSLRQAVLRSPMKLAESLNIPEWQDAGVREVIQEEKGPLYIASLASTRLDDVATRTYHGAPDDIARLGFAIAHELDAGAPQPEDLPEEVRSLAAEIAQALKQAERPLILSGTGCGSESVIQAAANVAWALCANGHPAELSFCTAACNSLGLALVGGGSLEAVFQFLQEDGEKIVIVLENDLYRQAGTPFVEALLNEAQHLIVIDHLENATTTWAEIVLPAATFAEGDGTLVNNEGRAQRFYQVFPPGGEVQESWRWLRDIIAVSGEGAAGAWSNLDDISAALAEALPVFRPVLEIAPPASFRIVGQKIPRQPARYSGRTSMNAQISVHEPKPPDDPDTPLAFSMEGYTGQPPAALIPRFWAPGWNSVQSLNKFQDEVGGALRGGDPGRRLIEPAQHKRPTYFNQIPGAFEQQAGKWLIAPLYHIFGSEELSILTPGIAERAPRPYVGLNPEDASSLDVREGETVSLPLEGEEWRLPVRLLPGLPEGVAGLPAGLPGLEGLSLPAWSRLKVSEGAASKHREAP